MSKQRLRQSLHGPARTALLAGLLGVLFASPLFASPALSLYFVGAKRNASSHVYLFTGHYNSQYESLAERLLVSVKGTYIGASGIGRETSTLSGSYGTLTITATVDCAHDPWLNPHVSCHVDQYGHLTSVSGSSQAISHYDLNGYCYTTQLLVCTRNDVPKKIVPLVRNGPPAPQVVGPTTVWDNNKANLTLRYQAGVAQRYRVQRWYCPSGAENAPTNSPGDLGPGDGVCKSWVAKPMPVPANSFSKTISMSYPQPMPKAGIWFVRARLDSNDYGAGSWGHWHRTVAKATMHFPDAPRPPLSVNRKGAQVVPGVHLGSPSSSGSQQNGGKLAPMHRLNLPHETLTR